jgi:lysophospholipase L1-like esterase
MDLSPIGSWSKQIAGSRWQLADRNEIAINERSTSFVIHSLKATVLMKTILCYGDSNTWGSNPDGTGRFPYEQRWVTVLQRQIGDGYLVIAEGLGGRTTVWDDPIEGHKNGSVYLPPCLASHKPLDLVVIMLGTNDLKMRFSLPASDIARGAGVLVDIVRKSEAGINGAPPQVLLLAPPPLSKLTCFAEMFAGSEAKSKLFGQYYRQIAQERGCAFFNAGDVITSSQLDGIHLEAEEHRKLGEAVATAVQAILEA